jgi:hypothetical protein
MEVEGAALKAQFGSVDFHVMRYKGRGARFIVAVKNKWVVGWTRAWFYYIVSLHIYPHGGSPALAYERLGVSDGAPGKLSRHRLWGCVLHQSR